MLKKNIYFFVFIFSLPIFIFAQTSFKTIDKKETNKKIVALTFDADMTSGMQHSLKKGVVKSWYNKEVIKVLEENKVPATLFLTGMWIEAYPEATKELSQNPLFELGNHTYSHRAFTENCYKLKTLDKSEAVSEIEKTEKLLSQYTSKHIKLFRFPGLCKDQNSLEVVSKLGYVTIGGDVSSGDAFQKNSDAIIKNVLTRVKSGSIVVMHLNGGPNAPKTAEALNEIVLKLKAEGYSFVKVSELIKE